MRKKLTVNGNQRIGLVSLSVLLGVVSLIMVFACRLRKDPQPESLSEEYSLMEDSLMDYIAQSDSIRKAGWKNSSWRRNNERRNSVEGSYRDHSSISLVKVEINGADTNELKTIRGVGSYFARKIVNFRTALGGYVSRSQLLEVYRMDSVRYLQILPQIDLDPSKVVKIRINEATVDELRRHPYITYSQAKSIVKYRENGKIFRGMEDPYGLNVMEQDKLKKLEPYLTFD